MRSNPVTNFLKDGTIKKYRQPLFNRPEYGVTDEQIAAAQAKWNTLKDWQKDVCLMLAHGEGNDAVKARWQMTHKEFFKHWARIRQKIGIDAHEEEQFTTFVLCAIGAVKAYKV